MFSQHVSQRDWCCYSMSNSNVTYNTASSDNTISLNISPGNFSPPPDFNSIFYQQQQQQQYQVPTLQTDVQYQQRCQVAAFQSDAQYQHSTAQPSYFDINIEESMVKIDYPTGLYPDYWHDLEMMAPCADSLPPQPQCQAYSSNQQQPQQQHQQQFIQSSQLDYASATTVANSENIEPRVKSSKRKRELYSANDDEFFDLNDNKDVNVEEAGLTTTPLSTRRFNKRSAANRAKKLKIDDTAKKCDERQRNAAIVRERQRCKDTAIAFDELRSHLPTAARGRCNKIQVLKLAIEYIAYLEENLFNMERSRDVTNLRTSLNTSTIASIRTLLASSSLNQSRPEQMKSSSFIEKVKHEFNFRRLNDCKDSS